MIDLDELDRLEALHREAQKDPCDRGATCTKKCWRNYPCCVRKDRDDVQFRNAAADALPELLRAARKAATMTSAEGVISSLKATLESRRREVVAVTAERDSARAECERLRKLFDDAGAGEHNVLALIDHYQDEALRTTSELAQARRERDAMAADYNHARITIQELRDYQGRQSRQIAALESLAEDARTCAEFVMRGKPPLPRDITAAMRVLNGIGGK